MPGRSLTIHIAPHIPYYAMALIRLPFVIANTIALNISFRPPNATPDSNELSKYREKKETRDILTPLLGVIVPLLQILNVVFGLCEVYVLLATAIPSLRIPYLHTILLPAGAKVSSVDDFYLSPVFVGGSILQYASAYMRLLCFHTLGRHFTFELSFRKEHKLITAGPYSIVRHPSYLAGISVLVGMIITQLLSPGSWWVECNMWHTWQGQAFGIFWIGLATLFTWGMLSRVPKEDRMLRTEFKGQWAEWAQRTPYTVLPFVW